MAPLGLTRPDGSPKVYFVGLENIQALPFLENTWALIVKSFNAGAEWVSLEFRLNLEPSLTQSVDFYFLAAGHDRF